MNDALQLLAEPGSPTVDVLLTTNPGLEDIVVDELCSRLDAAGLDRPVVEQRPRGFHGHVIAHVPGVSEPGLMDVVLKMRSIHHVMQPLYGFDLPTVEDGANPFDVLDVIYRVLRDRGVPSLEEASTFRVTTKRSGVHPFTSIDVQRHAGAALVERYGCSVDLTDFDVNVRVDVFGDQCSVGLQRTRQPLSRRHARIYKPRAALKANVAFALLQMARIGDQRASILDPFCGSGTILLEAAQLLPRAGIHGSDFSEEAVAGCRDNIAADNLGDRIDVRLCDARFMGDVYEGASFEAIVTNPPFGVRLGRGMNYLTFYRAFFEQAARVLKPGGRIVMMAWKRGLVDKANQFDRGFRRVHVKVIETGGIYPRAYVFERR